MRWPLVPLLAGLLLAPGCKSKDATAAEYHGDGWISGKAKSHDAPTAGGAVSDPSTILSNLEFWVKSDTGTWQTNDCSTTAATSDTDPVGGWVDQANSVCCSQSVAASKPTLQLSEVNSLPAIRFDGTDDELDCGDIATVDGDASLTIYLVWTQATLAAQESMVTKWEHGTATAWAVGTHQSNTDEERFFIAASANSGGAEYLDTTDHDRVGDTYNITTYWYDGTQAAADRAEIYEQTTLVGTTPASLPASMQASAAVLNLGAFTGSISRYLNGDLVEVVISGDSDDSSTRSSMVTYFTDRYAL